MSIILYISNSQFGGNSITKIFLFGNSLFVLKSFVVVAALIILIAVRGLRALAAGPVRPYFNDIYIILRFF